MTIGHTHQNDILERMRRTHTVPHTLIFTGPDHVGKKQVALSFFARLITRGDSAQKTAAKQESTEKRIVGGLHPDVLLCGEDGELSVDVVRNIRRFLRLSPLEADIKCVLIDNAHHLGRIGSNTLLKTLEEPAGHTYTILVTPRPEKLPQTIRSRAMLLSFAPCATDDLLSLVSKTKQEVLKKEMGWIAGRPGLLKRWVHNKNDPHVVLRRAYFFEGINILDTEGVAPRLALAEKISKAENPEHALEAIVLALRHALITSSSPLNPAQLRRLQEVQEWLRFSNVNTRLALEHALMPPSYPPQEHA